jgi:hypothetical protein
LVDPGKEAFQMARMRLLWPPSPRAKFLKKMIASVEITICFL